LAILLITIGLGIYIGVIIKGDSFNIEVNNTTNEQDVPGGVNSSEGIDDFYNWETELNSRLIELYYEVFPKSYNYDLKLGESLEVNLHTLEEKYGLDISEFNTDEIKCDVYKSRIKVTNDYEEGIMVGSRVYCEKVE